MASSTAQTPPIETPNDDITTPAPQITDSDEPRSIHSLAASSEPPPNTHRCFICLVDEPEASLPADWSTPCTCTLEGHHECLMAWITDLENQSKEVKCPICKSPIIVTGRWDLAIYLNNYVINTFSKWSPQILFGFIASGALVSSSIYGLKAIDLFAGPEATMEFLFGTEDRVLFGLIRYPIRVADRTRIPPINLVNFAILPFIAPGLVLNRIPLDGVGLFPTSVLYATFVALINHADDYFTWPPSPQRALAIYPAVRSTYFQLHSTISKNLEKKWEAKASQQQIPIPARDEQAAVGRNFFDFDFDMAIVDDEEAIRRQQGNNRRNRVAQGKSLENFLAGSLLFPGVCYGMGELLRYVLPSRLVNRPASGFPTGLLQERWGRSLVGGCLFVVLKDVFFLWVKYRRIMTRSSRRIRNAENRTRRG
ncbi:uncharacterized protein F4812DRAFT_430156 [Daldinia caldariorum]|uniref:uncharacterized protein n=1 Tax=Daldinia caldariorum TaxID=326644 RepID=UPI002007E890|nr:uncharacterized protein F4812DRAFT_430156 [Daldinia caldariorum]KAI1467610.1 hypothetical protein F4812DRAFT_430156 [Daldinia caldariorum]